MKKTLLLVSLLFFGLVGVTGATTWTDTYYPEDVPLYMAAGGLNETEDFTLDIKNGGFDPGFWGFGADDVLWYQVSLYVTDDQLFGLDGWDINYFQNNEEFLTVSTDFMCGEVGEETYEVDFHGGLFNDPLFYDMNLLGLLSINYDGTLGINLTATQGDFYFWGASVTASDTAPVPESGTLLLLGTGLAFYRRKKMK